MADHAFTWDATFSCWITAKHVPFLNRILKITIEPESEDGQPTERQIALVDAIGSFSTSIRESINDAAEKYRKEIDDEVDLSEYDLGHINRRNIENHYMISKIVIPPIGACKDDYHFLEGSCEWEEEHGLEILLRNGEVIYCGPMEALYLNDLGQWDDYIGTGT